MSKLMRVLIAATVGAGIGGLTGAVLAAVPAFGTSVALPGVGLVVAGWLALGIIGGLRGAVVGFLIGTIVGAWLVFARR